jgi:hypothetical protein
LVYWTISWNSSKKIFWWKSYSNWCCSFVN